MMSGIVFALSGLKVEFIFKGRLITRNPKNIYRYYIQYFPLHSFDATSWLFNLVIIFINAFPIVL